MRRVRHAPTLNMLGTDILMSILTLLRRSSPLAAAKFTATCTEILALGKQQQAPPILKISMLNGAIALAHVELRNNRFKASELTFCSHHAIAMDEGDFWESLEAAAVASTTRKTRLLWNRYNGNAQITAKILKLLFYSPRDDATPWFSLKKNNDACDMFNYRPSENPELVTLGCAHNLKDVLNAGRRDMCIEVSGKLSFANDVVYVSFNVDLHFRRRRPPGPRDNNEFDDEIVFSNARIINLIIKSI